jgi:hypothetical protein
MAELEKDTIMEPIYKVNHIINGNINTIYVFNGGKHDSNNKIFNDNETEIIDNNKIKIVYCKQQIHLDDSIGMIKIKILNEIKQSISLDEIYLYCQKIEQFNSVSLYQTLTQNKKLTLTNVRLNQFISNIVTQENGRRFTIDKEKDTYDYDDIVEMNLDNKKFIVNKVLGQKFFIIENEYPYVVNPYDVKSYDSFLERNSRKSLTTLNSHLLLNSCSIVNNNIYLCLAQDVLLFSEKKNVPQELTLKIYYPFLYENNINNIDDIKSNQGALIKNNETYLNDSTKDYFNTIDMFYNIYNLRKTELKYISKGIKYLKLLIKPVYKINIPLEILFKILHATQENPLIKYNPSSRQENIYRIFTDKISTDGRKIPYLKKGLIFKLIKNIGKSKSVSVYINTNDAIDINQFICEFDENGFVTIICELEKVMNEREINELLQTNINPIIQEISNFLEQSGYKISLFDTIKSDNVEIKQLTYESNIKIKHAINLDNYKGCISSIFNNESSSFKKDIHLRFKRVSNFNKVTSQEAFIMEKSAEGYRGSEIIDALLENFQDDLTRSQAEELVQKVANEIQLERGVKKIDIKIKDNPGFKTTIQLEQKTGVITIRVENINDIFYLDTIPIYLDSIIRITQDKNSTRYSTKKINEICSSQEKVEIKMMDIISPVESQLSELEIPSIDEENEDVEYTKMIDSSKSYSYSEDEDKPKNALDLFFDEEESEEPDEEQDGDEKSEASIESYKSNKSNKEGGQLGKGDNSDNGDNGDNSDNGDSSDYSDNEENEVINIDNLPLKKKEPYFQTRIENLDPALIIKEDTKEFNSYVRTCSSTMKRHPVILTNDELDKINKEHPGFLRDEDVIKYGSNPNKQFSYICPRYWCLKNNTVVDPKDLTEVIVNGKKELKSPNCGYVLPDNAKTVKPGYYVYEFYKPKSGNKDYKRYPGFQLDKHPQGYCLPCCFEKYNTIGRIDAKKHCNQDTIKDKKTDLITNVEEKDKSKQKTKGKEEDEYIIGPDKFPISQGRWGYLPPQIQQILHEVNADCQISKTNTNLKNNHPCLLRHGVEINDKQSFLSCVSDLLFYGSTNTQQSFSPSIKEIKDKIIEALTIDNFITYQNGNLVNDFKSADLNLISIEPESNNNIKKHTSSKLYSKINKSNEEELLYLKKVISAFENFINYLNDDDVIIDHTYLWDIISKPNAKLFIKGVNLIIFKIPNDDITNNVELLCPSNHYSNEFYETRKPTVFIIKEDKYYEPIYSYTITNKKYSVIKFFNEYDPHLSKSMRNIFKELIKPVVSTFCKPLDSMPNVYKAKRAPLLISLIQKLDKYDYNILKLVMNFNNKIIGVIAESPTLSKLSGFVPCYPSSYSENIKNNLDFVFMNDISLWKSYEETFDFLMQLYNKSTKRKNDKSSDLHCKPMFQVVEDELVVGIITETNQFVQISQPIPEIDIKFEQKLPTLKNSSYIISNKNSNVDEYTASDAIITTSNNVDTERVDYIKKITYETNFYNIFRNTIRILLNDYSNIKIREQIENEILKDYIIYTQKLQKIKKLLKELVNNKIQFTGDENYYKLIDEFTTCLVKNKESCTKSPNLCIFTENNSCNLILPNKNLITGKENEEIYFGKMSDELIRYSRIQSFILQPQSFLSFGNIGYNLRENEIIMLQSLLTQEYFETLEPAIINKYVKFNSYDETEPIITQTYENKVRTSELENNKTTLLESCNKQNNDKISSGIWKNCFPEKYKEITYAKNINCTFEIIIDIIERKTGEKFEINRLKNILFEEYVNYIKNYSEQILNILIAEGKKTLGDQVNSKMLSFSSFIYSDNYFLTIFDFWLLVNKFKIPTFFISTKKLLQTNYEKNIFLGYGNENDMFCFIIVPALGPEQVPSYKLVTSDKNDVFISIQDIKQNCEGEIKNAFDKEITIENYLKQFIKISKPKKVNVRTLSKKLHIEQDDNNDDDNV